MNTDIESVIESELAGWIAQRRDFHRHPELGFTEYRTASIVAERLAGLGYAVRTGAEVMDEGAIEGRPDAALLAHELDRALSAGAVPRWTGAMARGLTGVVAELERGEGPVIALRFDMDALPLAEDTGMAHGPARAGFASCREGVMHACGHDGHTTIGLAVASLAVRFAARWRGTLRLIFQPAEEGGRGAKPMVAAGVVDDADYFFAAHLGCELASGRIATEAERMLFSTKWDVGFTGHAAHAAGNPHDGRNALLAGASAALNLHAIARHGVAATHVNVGRLVAGTARNVVPADCAMEVELRGESDDALAYMERRASDVLEGAARQYALVHALRPMGRTIGEPSDEASKAIVAAAAVGVAGVTEVIPGWPLGGGDDAAYFMRRMHERGRHACYFVIGSALAACHHASRFEFDERDIAIGARLFMGILERASQAQAQATAGG